MTKAAPHSHWSHYDENNEQASFDAIHAKLAAGKTDTAEDEKRLADLSQSSGYGDADSFICDVGLEQKAGETPQKKALREQFDGYMNGDYFENIDRSFNILKEASPEARPVADRVCQAMRDAYERGRKMRIDQDSAPSPAP